MLATDNDQLATCRSTSLMNMGSMDSFEADSLSFIHGYSGPLRLGGSRNAPGIRRELMRGIGGEAMRTILVVTTCTLLVEGNVSAANQTDAGIQHDDFQSFYQVNSALTHRPPEIGSLRKICEQPNDGVYLSFWGESGGNAFLAVFSRNPVSDLSKVISLQVLFAPFPTARPASEESSLDWGYIFDRNGDGRVDYLIYLDAARPIAPDQFPENYPKGSRLSQQDLELYFHRVRLVFTHLADDNFDGVVDAIVAPIPDSERPVWIGSYGVLRSSRFDGGVDRDWTFKADLGQSRIYQPTGRVPRSDGGYLLKQILPRPLIQEGSEWLRSGTKLLSRINDGANQCKLGRNSIRNK